MDKSGRPVSDLRPEDFSVRIDGAPRTVSFATFYGGERPAPPPPPTAVSSFVTNVTPTPGRAVVFVVDLESLTAGYEKLIFETAGKLVDGLGSADSVGLLAIPGTAIELTSDRARVKPALASLRGRALQSRQKHALTVMEADGFAKRDTRLTAQVIQRECPAKDPSCPREVEDEAKLLTFKADRKDPGRPHGADRIEQSASVSRKTQVARAVVRRPSVHRQRQGEVPGAAATEREAGALTYVVHIEQPEMDDSRSRPAGVSWLPRTDLALGLQNIAGATRGEYYAGVGTASGVSNASRRRSRAPISSAFSRAMPTPTDALTGSTCRSNEAA